MMSLKPYRATAHWKKIRIQVLRRDAYTCAYCGDTANEVDHRIAKVKGGEDTLDNLVAACRRCNIQKKDQDEAVFLAQRSTPPAFRFKISPKGANQSKSVKNGHTTIHVDADSPFISPGQPGAN
jgi:5-methylcytosine-specific restriction endonuclease McrA